jgi:hypothetical protein
MRRRVLVVVPAVSINFSLTYATTAIGILSRFRLCASRLRQLTIGPAVIWAPSLAVHGQTAL